MAGAAAAGRGDVRGLWGVARSSAKVGGAFADPPVPRRPQASLSAVRGCEAAAGIWAIRWRGEEANSRNPFCAGTLLSWCMSSAFWVEGARDGPWLRPGATLWCCCPAMRIQQASCYWRCLMMPSRPLGPDSRGGVPIFQEVCTLKACLAPIPLRALMANRRIGGGRRSRLLEMSPNFYWWPFRNWALSHFIWSHGTRLCITRPRYSLRLTQRRSGWGR